MVGGIDTSLVVDAGTLDFGGHSSTVPCPSRVEPSRPKITEHQTVRFRAIFPLQVGKDDGD